MDKMYINKWNNNIDAICKVKTVATIAIKQSITNILGIFCAKRSATNKSIKSGIKTIHHSGRCNKIKKCWEDNINNETQW